MSLHGDTRLLLPNETLQGATMQRHALCCRAGRSAATAGFSFSVGSDRSSPEFHIWHRWQQKEEALCDSLFLFHVESQSIRVEIS